MKTNPFGYSEERVDAFLERLDSREQQAATQESHETITWWDWLGFGLLLLIVSAFATPFGALAMLISGSASGSQQEFLRKKEIEKIREDELIRERVRNNP